MTYEHEFTWSSPCVLKRPQFYILKLKLKLEYFNFFYFTSFTTSSLEAHDYI